MDPGDTISVKYEWVGSSKRARRRRMFEAFKVTNTRTGVTEICRVGDAVLLLAPDGERPYIGFVTSIFESTGRKKKMRCKWFYRADGDVPPRSHPPGTQVRAGPTRRPATLRAAVAPHPLALLRRATHGLTVSSCQHVPVPLVYTSHRARALERGRSLTTRLAPETSAHPCPRRAVE